MMKIKLTKLSTLPDALHSENIPDGFSKEGLIFERPKVGECFWMQYEEGVDRHFRTSTVTEIIDRRTFKTKNSIYTYETLDTIKPHPMKKLTKEEQEDAQSTIDLTIAELESCYKRLGYTNSNILTLLNSLRTALSGVGEEEKHDSWTCPTHYPNGCFCKEGSQMPKPKLEITDEEYKKLTKAIHPKNLSSTEFKEHKPIELKNLKNPE